MKNQGCILSFIRLKILKEIKFLIALSEFEYYLSFKIKLKTEFYRSAVQTKKIFKKSVTFLRLWESYKYAWRL